LHLWVRMAAGRGGAGRGGGGGVGTRHRAARWACTCNACACNVPGQPVRELTWAASTRGNSSTCSAASCLICGLTRALTPMFGAAEGSDDNQNRHASDRMREMQG
jgi:hypothetical protein